MRFFMDFQPGGALCVILSSMYRFKSEQRWRKFDFTASKVSDLNFSQPLETYYFVLAGFEEGSKHPDVTGYRNTSN